MWILKLLGLMIGENQIRFNPAINGKFDPFTLLGCSPRINNSTKGF